MTASQLLQVLSWRLYLLIFVLVAVRTMRRPTHAHVDILLFFGDTTAIIVLGTIVSALSPVPPFWVSDLTGALLMALAYLLLRLVADFSRVPRWLMRVSELGVGLSVLAIVALPTPMPTLPALLLVAYFLTLIGYDTWAFVRQAQRTSGVTRRRMQAIAAGTVCLGLVLLLAGLQTAAPDRADLWVASSQVVGLISGIAYFIGFAPPTWLRRAWQEPELRALFTRAATLPHLASTRAIITALEEGAVASLGGRAQRSVSGIQQHGGYASFTSRRRPQLPARRYRRARSDSFKTFGNWILPPSQSPGAPFSNSGLFSSPTSSARTL